VADKDWKRGVDVKLGTQPTILIVGENECELQLMRWALRSEFRVLIANELELALHLVQSRRLGAVLLDIEFLELSSEKEKSLAPLLEMVGDDGLCKLIVLSTSSGTPNLRPAIAAKTFNYFWRPLDFGLLGHVLRQACWEAESEGRVVIDRLQFTSGIDNLIGTSEGMRRVSEAIRKAAPADVPVLITGESGTGKELAARAIHKLSGRKHGPFVPINCGAIPEQLLEAELFGYEKGAFTGAWRQNKGKIEYANGGTLFLDEIGELPVNLQVKLLRFLEDYHLERIGGRKSIPVNTRIVAATKTELHKAMAESKFREDLYYRLSVLNISLPPLRARKADVHLIARAFINGASRELGKRVDGLTREAVEAMDSYSWPGNVRELRNKIQRAVIMAEGRLLTPDDLELPCQAKGDVAEAISFKAARDRFQANFIIKAVVSCNGNINKMARELGLSRPTIYYFINKYGLHQHFKLPDAPVPKHLS